MSKEILEMIVTTIARIVIIIFMIWLMPALKNWLLTKTDNETAEFIVRKIAEYVQAADQMFKAEDPTGEKRKTWVVNQLKGIGIEVTNDTDAIIESEVLKLKPKE